MQVYFNCFVCKAGKLDDDFKKLSNFIQQQHARRKRIRLLECRHQVPGPLPVEWTPTLSPEHVACKPFSDTPNPYGMRRRNKGTYESYNTNNGENHCILARKVKWFRELVSWFARSGMCCMIRAASINHYPFSGLRGWDLGARRRSVKKSRPLPFARRVRDGIGVAQRRAEIGHRLGAGVSVPDTANASPIRASRARRTICARLRCRKPSLLGTSARRRCIRDG
jgi:hypothetical protein